MMRSTIQGAFFALGICAALLGCEKKSATEVTAADAGDQPTNQANVDPELAKAVAAASASGPAGSANVEGGPPESGVFEPGAADKELALGSAPKLTLGADGSPPMVTVASMQPAPGTYPLRVRLQSQRGRQADVPLDFRLSIEVSRPKPAEAGAQNAEAVNAVAKVVGVDLDQALVGGANKDASAVLAKLKGSTISFRIAPNGAGTDFRVTPAKGAERGLEESLKTIAEVLAMIALPYPSKALGAGGYWGATTRESIGGIDTLAYRLVNVTGVSDGVLSLKMETKRYAAGASQRIPGLTPESDGIELQRFEARGEGTLKVAPGSIFPLEANLAHSMGAIGTIATEAKPVGLQEKSIAIIEGEAPKAPAARPAPAPGAAPGAAAPASAPPQ